MSKKPPERLVEMGRISAPFGVRGWVRIQPFTETADSLQHYASWWLGDADGWQEYKVEQAQTQGADVVAKLAGCDERDLAAAMQGRRVAVPREAFPPAPAGEFYWADLVGLRVRNGEGLDFGTVASMIETGANDVMVVADDQGSERLIPFVADVVKRVDVAAGVIDVDWGADY